MGYTPNPQRTKHTPCSHTHNIDSKQCLPHTDKEGPGSVLARRRAQPLYIHLIRRYRQRLLCYVAGFYFIYRLKTLTEDNGYKQRPLKGGTKRITVNEARTTSTKPSSRPTNAQLTQPP